MRSGAMTSRLRALWANPWVRRPALLALAFGGMLAGCRFIIDQLGKDAWRHVQKQLAEEGETLDFRRLLPPAVPDEENFCAVGPLRYLGRSGDEDPSIREEATRHAVRINSLRYNNHVFTAAPRDGFSWGIPLNLREVAAVMREERGWPIPAEEDEPAADVAEAFAGWDAFIDELTPGLARPGASWGSVARELPRARPLAFLFELHGGSFAFALAEHLRLRGMVAAESGDVRRAVNCVHCLARLAEASGAEPLLMGHFTAEELRDAMADVLWELCWTQRGTVEDWERLERIFASLDPRASMLQGMRGELAIGVDLPNFAYDHSLAEFGQIFYGPSGIPVWHHLARSVAPRGFSEGAAAEVAGRELNFLIRPLREGDLSTLLRSRETLQRMEEADERQPWNLTASYAGWIMRDTGYLSRMVFLLPRVVYQTVVLEQAVIACALERARLAQGRYPASLDGLTLADGRPLPLDGLTGEPMHYRVTPGGRYLLWSPGPDGRDDHGVRGQPTSTGWLDGPAYVGDWVWSYALEPKR